MNDRELFHPLAPWIPVFGVGEGTDDMEAVASLSIEHPCGHDDGGNLGGGGFQADADVVTTGQMMAESRSSLLPPRVPIFTNEDQSTASEDIVSSIQYRPMAGNTPTNLYDRL
jgi:hypothetical protein